MSARGAEVREVPAPTVEAVRGEPPEAQSCRKRAFPPSAKLRKTSERLQTARFPRCACFSPSPKLRKTAEGCKLCASRASVEGKAQSGRKRAFPPLREAAQSSESCKLSHAWKRQWEFLNEWVFGCIFKDFEKVIGTSCHHVE